MTFLQSQKITKLTSGHTHYYPADEDQFISALAECFPNLQVFDYKLKPEMWERLLDTVTNTPITSLRSLVISQTIECSLLEQIILRFPELEELVLYFPGAFSGMNLFQLLKKTKIQKLTLQQMKFHHDGNTNNIFEDESMWNDWNLKSLTLSQCDFTTEEFASLFSSKACPIDSLHINHGGSIKDEVLCNSNLSLKEVSFMQTNYVTENGWAEFIERTPSLTNISLAGHFRHVTENVLKTILSTCKIESLDISDCKQITGQCIKELLGAGNFPSFSSLKCLDLSSIKLHPTCLEEMVCFKNLENLSIKRGCYKGSEVVNLLKGLANLKSLHLYSDCPTGVVEQILKISSLKELSFNQPKLPTKLVKPLVDMKIQFISDTTLTPSAMYYLQSEIQTSFCKHL